MSDKHNIMKAQYSQTNENLHREDCDSVINTEGCDSV